MCDRVFEEITSRTSRSVGDTAAETMSQPAKRSKVDNGGQSRDEGLPGDTETAAKDELVAEQGDEGEADEDAEIEDTMILQEQSAAMKELETFQAKIRDVRTLRHSHVLIMPKAQKGICCNSFVFFSGVALRWRRVKA